MKIIRIILLVVVVASFAGYFYITNHRVAEPCTFGADADDTSTTLLRGQSENCVHYRYMEFSKPLFILGAASGVVLAVTFIVKKHTK